MATPLTAGGVAVIRQFLVTKTNIQKPSAGLFKKAHPWTWSEKNGLVQMASGGWKWALRHGTRLGTCKHKGIGKSCIG